MTKSFSRRTFFGGLLGTAATVALASCSTPGSEASSASGAAGGRLTVSSFGGTTEKIYHDVVYAPYQAKHGTQITQVTLQSDDALARLIAQAGKAEIDLFQFSGGQEGTAKKRGLVAPIGDLGANLPHEFVDADGKWAAVAVIPEGIVYNTERIPTPPASYLDFLKPEYQGHIAFPNITSGYGVDFLVMLAYAHGGSEHDIDPGFEALAKIAPKAHIFQAAAEMQTLFAQGDVWLMPYDSSNAFRAANAGLPVKFTAPKEGSPANFITHVIAKDSPNIDTARQVVRGALEPAVQAQLAEKLRWLPVNPATKLEGDLAKEIPVGEAALASLKVLDRAAIAEQRPAWTDRFNREIATL